MSSTRDIMIQKLEFHPLLHSILTLVESVKLEPQQREQRYEYNGQLTLPPPSRFLPAFASSIHEET